MASFSARERIKIKRTILLKHVVFFNRLHLGENLIATFSQQNIDLIHTEQIKIARFSTMHHLYITVSVLT